MSALAGMCSPLLRVYGDLVAVLRSHAAQRPDQSAFSFLVDGQPDVVLTYSQLDRRARAVAARLQDMGLAGRRVVLAYPQGLDFITGFFGCLYAGCVAVPTYLPHRRTLDRFGAIAADAEACLVLSTGPCAAQHRTMTGTGAGRTEAASPAPWLATDQISDACAKRWEVPDITPGSLAMLQYTSGSTSEPKGVMLSHANLMHNTRAIFAAFGMAGRGDDSGVFWLPTYHDMGLVGGVLVPMLAGVPSAQMAPAAFLQHPLTWLAAISNWPPSIS